jgi:hypothetical protein
MQSDVIKDQLIMKLTNTQKDEIVTRYNSGEKVKNLIVSMNISRKKIYSTLAELKKTKLGKEKNPINPEVICNNYRNGTSIVQLTKQFKISRETALKHLITNKVEIRNQNQKKPKSGIKPKTRFLNLDELKDIQFRLERGDAIAQISRDTGRSKLCVRRTRNKLKTQSLESLTYSWTQEEDEIIKANFPLGGTRACQNLLNKHRLADIQSRAYALGARLLKRGTDKIKLTKDELKNIITLYRQGVSSVALAKKFNVSFNTILENLKKCGVNARGVEDNYQLWLTKNREEMLKLFNDGETVTDIKKILHTNYKTIKRALSDCGIIEWDHRFSKTKKGNRYIFKDRLSRTFSFKSGWEKKVANYLDSNNIHWNYEEFTYKVNTTHYTPDFSIYTDAAKTTFSHLLEVKGYYREKNRTKIELFKTLYPNIKFELWLEQDLRRLGIVK